MLQIRLDQKAFLFHDLQPIISDNSSVLGSRFISDQYTNTLFPLQDLLGIDMEEDEVWIRLPMESFQGRCVELVVSIIADFFTINLVEFVFYTPIHISYALKL
ncbi:hypothetical protein J3Q64DRAFT_1695745 [Phycomyces blakesleeanus]|uniref:Uncharacterized protein n=1 Tax=Phycomyces blakesleeanus TaxID=4837 RepID=A0ABR3B8A8_PHYBL